PLARRSQRLGRHDVAAYLALVLEDVARVLADADVVHTGDHAGGNHIAGAQGPSATGSGTQRERERSERPGADGRLAAADDLLVDVRERTDFVQRPPVGDRITEDHAPVIAEIRDHGARTEVVERGERAAGDFHADVQALHQT